MSAFGEIKVRIVKVAVKSQYLGELTIIHSPLLDLAPLKYDIYAIRHVPSEFNKIFGIQSNWVSET